MGLPTHEQGTSQSVPLPIKPPETNLSDPDQVSLDGSLLLVSATAGEDQLERIKELLAAGANPKALSGACVTNAILGNKPEVFECLLNHGEFEPKLLEGFLKTAGSYGNARCCQLLLDAGAAIEADDSDGFHAPLRGACRNGNKETIELLLNRGAYKEENPGLYFQAICALGRTEEIMSYLRAFDKIGYNTGVKLENLYEGFQLAAQHASIETLRAIMAHIPLEKKWEETALRLRAARGDTPAVKEFLSRGISARTWDDYALRTACEKGHKETAQVLIKNYSTPELQEAIGRKELEEGSKASMLPLLNEELSRRGRAFARRIRDESPEITP